MFPPKKKPAVAIAIGVGKPKPKFGAGKPSFGGPKPKSPMEDLEGPDPAEGPGETDESDDMPPTAEHEAAESPEYEANEEYGQKITADIDAAGAEMGMEPAHARMAAGKFLTAIGACLLRDSEPGEEQGEEMIDTEGPMRPGRYGQ